MNVILQTERLRLRQWRPCDIDQLKCFLQDREVMYAYEHAFSDEEVLHWLNWNLSSYQSNGYGLWAIELCGTGEVVGECGLTNQTVAGKVYLEIGYHLMKQHWHKGYAIEAARACKQYTFEKLNQAEAVSIIRDTNIASMNVAIRNGMFVKKRFIKHYYGIAMPHYLLSIKTNKLYVR
ncbi:MAG: GNAT family N-acetyltransferase [Sporolactobacillus sp.]|jgi:RimJ/RimL family protein N-acetyltransferase|nr:GNAT family N-acetyltransferase [Sporolactobacillus sp.]